MKRISVVIINKNDRGITETLEALSTIKRTKPYEIIVVDGSDGKLSDIAVEFPNIRWMPYRGSINKKITIPEQRNVGVMASKGDIIVFIDANCIPKKDWLANLVNPIMHGKELIVAGPVLSKGGHTIHDYTFSKKRNKKYIDESGTANMAFTRSLYNEIGGFDESFDYGSDVDFTWRIIESGHKLRYQPSAIILHDWGSKKHEIKRSFRYGRARARLYFKHRKKKSGILTSNLTLIIYPLFLLFLPLVFLSPFYLLILLIPLIKNYNQKPVQSVAEHLVYAAGILCEITYKIARKI